VFCKSVTLSDGESSTVSSVARLIIIDCSHITGVIDAMSVECDRLRFQFDQRVIDSNANE